MPRIDSRHTAAWLGPVLFVVAVVNGAGPYLRRTGFIESERYERFWDLHTGPDGFSTSPFGMGRRCISHRAVEAGGADPAGGGPPARYVFTVRKWEVPGKAAKDLFVAALVAASLIAWLRGRSSFVPLSRAWPAGALAGLVAWHAGAGLLRGSPAMTAAGLRGFAFLGVALAAGWVTGETFRRLVPWLVGLLAFELLLAPVELLRGVPVQGHVMLFGEIFAGRAAGTFVMPNTLGVFGACVVAAAVGFGESARLRALAWALGGLVVLVSGSATGVGILAAVGFASAFTRERRVRAIAAVGVGAGLVAATILIVTLRPDVVDSFAARALGFRATLEGRPRAVLLGQGLGLGTNAGSQLRVGLENEMPEVVRTHKGGDSAASALVLQTGVVGMVLYFAALGLAWRRTAPIRPLALALAAASLTLSVTEAFPVNLLVGFALSCAPTAVGSGPSSALSQGRRT